MSDIGQESELRSPFFTEIINSVTALNYEMEKPPDGALEKEEALKDRDARIKNRTMNLISVFKHYYKLPAILLIYPGSKDLKKTIGISGFEDSGEERESVYLLTSKNQLVSGDFVPGFLGIKKSKINNQQEIDVDGHWEFYGSLIKRSLIKLVPGLREKLDEKRYNELREKEEQK